jgi:hypothetical protein
VAILSSCGIALTSAAIPTWDLRSMLKPLPSGKGSQGPLRDGVWLDEESGRWSLHDYWDHAPEYVRKRRDRELQREEKGETLKRRTTADNGGRFPPPVAERRTMADSMPLMADDGEESAPNGRPPTPTPTPTPTLQSPPSAHSAAGGRGNLVEDAWIAEAAVRIIGAYPPSHTGGEYDAKRAVFEAIRLGLIVPDGAEPGKGATVAVVCASIVGWAKSDPWQKRGAIPKLRNFLERGVFLTPPPPPGSETARNDSRRAAGANDTPQASRVQRIV